MALTIILVGIYFVFIRKKGLSTTSKPYPVNNDFDDDMELIDYDYTNNPNDFSLPRGFRNNNPLNIKYDTDDNGEPDNDWMGLVGTDGTFCIFSSMAWGLRASLVILNNYKKKYGLTTIRSIISRWSVTDQHSYMNTVLNGFWEGFGLDDEIDFDNETHIYRLINAMIKVENGTSDNLNYNIYLYAKSLV